MSASLAYHRGVGATNEGFALANDFDFGMSANFYDNECLDLLDATHTALEPSWSNPVPLPLYETVPVPAMMPNNADVVSNQSVLQFHSNFPPGYGSVGNGLIPVAERENDGAQMSIPPSFMFPLYDARKYYTPRALNPEYGGEGLATAQRAVSAVNRSAAVVSGVPTSSRINHVEVNSKSKEQTNPVRRERVREAVRDSDGEDDDDASDDDVHMRYKKRHISGTTAIRSKEDDSCKKRVLFTPNQVSFLIAHFDKQVDRRFSNDEIDSISREVGLAPQQVRVFFQNRRARLKKKSSVSPVMTSNVVGTEVDDDRDHYHNTRHKAHAMLVSSAVRSFDISALENTGVVVDVEGHHHDIQEFV